MVVTYNTTDAREGLLEAIADATDQLALGLACLGEAYGLLDENSAQRLEDDLFAPVQAAYGRAKRTYSGFADRHALPMRAFESPSAGVASQGAKLLIEKAVEAVAEADRAIAALQDSMLPVEIGDPALRTGLSEVRTLVGDLSQRARGFTRTLGR